MVHPDLAVPTIDVRERIPNSVIESLARQIAEKFSPQKIILFGSYARGNPRPESDVDILVVMDTSMREVEQSIEISQQIDYLFGLDLLVYTPSHLKERLEMGDAFIQDILKEGKVLYEASGS
jgi:predicted nucleotidyltransferase